jgi:hypothetical protein
VSPLQSTQNLEGVSNVNPKATKTQPADVAADRTLEEQIRLRAYALYLDRGGEDGHDLDDWLRAEAEFTAGALKAAA